MKEQERDSIRRERLSPDFDWKRIISAPEDLKTVDPAVLKRILFDIFLIREFEHAVLKLKNDDCVWGPVHSSVGQESIAAAVMAALRKSDKIAGTHRAHHQFLSKVLKWALPEDWDPFLGAIPEQGQDVITRTLAEVMGLATGYCGGRGGSMHLRHKDAGVLGTNAIVGGGIPLATGAAFAEKFNRTDDVVVSFFSDGASNQGAFHEACNLAGLWDLPIIYFIENNHYAVGTSAAGACGVEDLSVRAAGYGMKARIVDGMDALAIYTAVLEACEDIRAGGCPYIIEAKCYRHYHHAGDQPGSSYGYRTKDEEAEWKAKDAYEAFPKALVNAGILNRSAVSKMKDMAETAVAQAVDFCTNSTTPRTVRAELWPNLESVSDGTRSSGREWEGITFSGRKDFNEFREMRYSDAIAEITGEWLKKNENVIVLGEEVANFGGGAYGATKGLPAMYPDRVLNTPISEAGFIGLACGAAMCGLKPVVEIMFPDFALVAADQLFNQIAKARHMYGNTTDLPIVVRTRVAIGCGYGGQHSMDPVALYALFPGWRIIAPSDAFDYIGLFNSAMYSLDPVLIVEHHSLYNQNFPVPDDRLDYFVPFNKARVAKSGEKVTVLAYSSMVGRCLEVSKQLEESGVSAEVIDLRTLDLPGIDYEAIGKSLEKTGMVVVVEEAPTSQSIGATIAAEVTERFFDLLDGPVMRVTSCDIPNPVSRALEKAAIVSDKQIKQAIERAAKRK